MDWGSLFVMPGYGEMFRHSSLREALVATALLLALIASAIVAILALTARPAGADTINYSIIPSATQDGFVWSGLDGLRWDCCQSGAVTLTSTNTNGQFAIDGLTISGFNSPDILLFVTGYLNGVQTHGPWEFTIPGPNPPSTTVNPVSLVLGWQDVDTIVITEEGDPQGGSWVLYGLDATPLDPPPAVPLPLTLPLFATGLALIGFAGYRRKRTRLSPRLSCALESAGTSTPALSLLLAREKELARHDRT